ncbi:MAG: DoxX family protein [Trueperaceae bacterium]
MVILSNFLQGFLALAFVISGGLKVIPGDNKPKQNFAKMRLPAWWLAPIGITEVLAGLFLVIGFFSFGWSALGAALAVVTMAGAVLAHIIQDEHYEGYPALILLSVGCFVLWLNWSEVMKLLA